MGKYGGKIGEKNGRKWENMEGKRGKKWGKTGEKYGKKWGRK